MTAPIDLCNRALSEIGSRVVISSFTDPSVAGVQCALHYDPLRQQLLRTAQWGFARGTAALSLLGSATDLPTPGAPYPWQFKYLYPPDCLKVRYVLPLPPAPAPQTSVPIVGTLAYTPWCQPRRSWRFLVANDSVDGKVLLSNVGPALVVYTVDVTDPDMFDSLFTNALVMGLASKLVIPLTGNAGMKQGFVKLAMDAILDARVADGNEAIPSTDHTVDWMAVRNSGATNYGVFGTSNGLEMGSWYGYNDNMSWGS